MKNKSWYFAFPVVSLIATMVPLLAAQERSSTPSASEQRAMKILTDMSQYLTGAEHFSVTIRDGYDAVQQSGQKIEYGEVRKVTVSRPDRLRFEIERSDGEKGLVIFNGKDLAVYTANNNAYATVSRPGTLDQAIKYAVDDLKIRVPLAMMLLSTLPTELDKLVTSADYVETTTITDVPCDHVAARTSRGVDFQVWVAQESEPLPRRVVITYSDGVYYAPQGNGYAVVPPPKGAVIPSVPGSATTAYGAGKSFAYSNGVFYEPAGKDYKIVQPPVGVLVTSIPNGAASVTVNGPKYFEFGGVWYRPFYSGSDVVYQTVPNPTG